MKCPKEALQIAKKNARVQYVACYPGGNRGTPRIKRTIYVFHRADGFKIPEAREYQPRWDPDVVVVWRCCSRADLKGSAIAEKQLEGPPWHDNPATKYGRYWRQA